MVDNLQISNNDFTYWPHEKCFQLAKELEMHPCLWCRRDEGYKKKINRLDAIKQISQSINVPQPIVDAKIKTLIGQFHRELKKETESKYVSKWYLYQPLKFLTGSMQLGETVDLCSPTENLVIEVHETEDDLGSANDESLEFMRSHEDQEQLNQSLNNMNKSTSSEFAKRMAKDEVWPNSKVIELAHILELRPCLWKRTHPDYRTRVVKLQAIKEIADQMNTDPIDVERKLKTISSQFSRELKKEQNMKRGEPYVSRWFLYNHLKFLQDSNVIRHSISSKLHLEQIVINDDDMNSSCQDHSIMDYCIPNEDSELMIVHPKMRHSSMKRKIDEDESMTPKGSARNSIYSELIEDEFDAFGKIVSKKIRCLKSPVLRSRLQFEISQLLYTMEMEDMGVSVGQTEEDTSPRSYGVYSNSQRKSETSETEKKKFEPETNK